VGGGGRKPKKKLLRSPPQRIQQSGAQSSNLETFMNRKKNLEKKLEKAPWKKKKTTEKNPSQVQVTIHGLTQTS
jgi:hypothetical protein